MKLSASLLLIALSIALGSAVPSPGTKTKKPSRLYIAHYENVLGPAMELKTYAGSQKDAATAAMASGKISAIVVNIGGDMVITGDLVEPVDISDPKADAENDAPIDYLRIGKKAVATSGNYRRGELIAGHWYSHIVDPRTGQPADDILSATVVSSDATLAGALATAFNVLTPQESIRLAARYPKAEYLILTRDGQRFESKGWKNLEAPKPETNIARPAGSRDNGFELIAAGPGFLASVSSATRSAGKYSLKWDGRDDKGNDLKPGVYIIKIEAAREHGTYQLMRRQMDFDQTPRKIDLPGNVEIASASLDYRKRSDGN